MLIIQIIHRELSLSLSPHTMYECRIGLNWKQDQNDKL